MLKASAWLPIAAGSPVAYEDDLLLDGGLLQSHPVTAAIDDGCTHILVLRTRMSTNLQLIDRLGQRLVAMYLQAMQPGLGEAYLATTREYRRLRLYTEDVSRSQKGPPFMLDVACTRGTHQVTTFSQDRGVLFQGIRAGYGTMMAALEDRTEQVYLRPTFAGCS